ncbi:MAG: hypothetical protein ACJ790_20955 [Myxococcaceae bacterium]
MEADQNTRQMIGLLSVLVALMLMLIIGLGAGALFAWSKYQQAQKAVSAAKPGSSVGQSVADATTLAAELDARREQLSKELDAQADLTEKRVHELEQRRSQDATVAKGPVDKAEQLFRITALGVDEGIAALEHLAGTQKALARAVAKEEPGQGGAGSRTPPEKRHSKSAPQRAR